MRFVALLLCSFLLAPMAYAADSVGVFTAVSGEVRVLRGENYLAATPGVEIIREDIIETGKDASAQLDMEDGSVLKLGPQTRIALSDYRLDGDKNVLSASLDVLSGWLRFAVKKLKTSGNYKFNTPVMVVGIRGTEGTIEAANEQGGLDLKEGKVDVTPFGKDASTFQPVQLNAGEFIQRMRGQPLAKLPQPPPAFGKRVPPVMKEKLAPRVGELKQRNVQPKVIRPVTREDAKRLMEKHPHLKEKLGERFKPLGVTVPGGSGKENKGKDETKGSPRAGIGGKVMHDRIGALPPASDKEPKVKDETKELNRGGFGGRVLQERKQKTGQQTDPKDVAEALRKRYETKQAPMPGMKDSPQIVSPQNKPLAKPPVGKLPDESPNVVEGKKLPTPVTPVPGVMPKPGGFSPPAKTKPGETPQDEKEENETDSQQQKLPLRSPATIKTTPFRPLQQ